jgi:hypothetical protein
LPFRFAVQSLAQVSRRFAYFSLMSAWLCASGAMLDIAQVFAWSRMFSGYVTCESFADAARDTFDPGKPCAICLAVGKAREASSNHVPTLPASGSEKIILIFDRPMEFVSPKVQHVWLSFEDHIASSPGRDVPVPPPRGTTLNILA